MSATAHFDGRGASLRADDIAGLVFTYPVNNAYISNSGLNGSNTVSVINTATNTVTATVRVGGFPSELAVNPAGTQVYVANAASGTVSVIDTATNTVIATVPVGISPLVWR